MKNVLSISIEILAECKVLLGKVQDQALQEVRGGTKGCENKQHHLHSITVHYFFFNFNIFQLTLTINLERTLWRKKMQLKYAITGFRKIDGRTLPILMKIVHSQKGIFIEKTSKKRSQVILL